MTKIAEKSSPKDVQLHIDKAFEIIDLHLPERYVPRVIAKLGDPQVKGSLIRNVRARYGKLAESNLHIVKALYEVSVENLEVKADFVNFVNP